MGGAKETYDIQLNEDHMGFIRATKDKYKIRDDSKVVRIALDYLLTNPNLHHTVFAENRCLRCE